MTFLAPAVALRARSPEGVVVGWQAQTPAAIGRVVVAEGSQACVGEVTMRLHAAYTAPRPRGSATPPQGCVRRQ